MHPVHQVIEDLESSYQWLRNSLRDNNIARVGTYSKKEPLMLVIHDESHRKIAGLYGYQSLGVFFIDLLWVDPAFRSKGLGARLLKAAEDHAKKHHVLYVRLETASFQSPDFYIKHGYEVFAKLPLLIEGEEQHYNYYLIKYLKLQ
ncbi:MAG: GNAT family N-acetyltransferase [Gammaproteobacteria bacterium]|nr:GNAT family N-acetyltransferase [Gammaproteobacteria bacterium]MBU1629217.1 GNAT family N-acetyltransferase [Gammaproteobacteria bacterium]MBU1927294.1 GNAT family N-acetyltransferase [Gammaproteobacteria bacterium]MBU2546327.1 GNAT family N-acetyltransferase [Gammaproteobacteria bacterium]